MNVWGGSGTSGFYCRLAGNSVRLCVLCPSSVVPPSIDITAFLMTDKKSSGAWIWAVVVLLIILHQDNWNWENDNAVFGIIPIGLFYHLCISIAASITWYVATRVAWPETFVEQVAAPSETKGAAE